MQHVGQSAAAPGDVFGLTRSVLGALFRDFPNGLAVVNRAHVLEATNPALRAALGLDGEAPEGATCCSLLGCRPWGANGAPGCVVDRVLRDAAPVRDVPVELPNSRGAAWLSASRLDSGHHAVVELRLPALETEPDPGSAPIRVRVLGRTRVETARGTRAGPWLEQRPGQLLKYLIAERERVVPIEDIAEAIWPRADFATPNTVRHLVHVLRKHIDGGGAHPSASVGIISSRGGYALDRRVVALDADEFADAANAALDAFAREQPAAPQLLEAALTLYGGDFLADDPYASWAQAERERLRSLAEGLLRALADLALAQDDLGAATAYLEVLADLEAFDEDVQRRLISLSLREGRRSRALRQYQAFALRLERAFGEQPSFAMADLIRDPAADVPLSSAGRWAREQAVRRSLG